MNGPVSLDVARRARKILRPDVVPLSDSTSQDRVYAALELILAAFLDEIIGELQAEQQRPTPPTQRGGARR